MKNILNPPGIATVIAAIVFILLACTNPVDPPTIPKTGSITGKAVFNNSEDNSGITIMLEQTDGLRSLAAINASRSIAQGVPYERSIAAARSIAATTTTAANGSYTLKNVPVGTYTISALSPNSLEKAVTVNITVRANETRIARTMNLTPVGSISGQIIVDDGSSAAMGFLVSVAGTSFMAVSGNNGRFTISGVPAQSGYYLIVMKGNYSAYYITESLSVTHGIDTVLPPKNITSSELGVDSTLVGIEIFKHPSQYLLGEQFDIIKDLTVRHVYEDGTRPLTLNYTAKVTGDSFTAGNAVTITVESSMDAGIKTSVSIPISGTLVGTGLPVLYIDTENAQDITEHGTRINMDMEIVSNNPAHDITRIGLGDQIWGRGNASWDYPKKPYHIRFADKIKLFGLEASRHWVLLAEYRSPTLLQNAIGLELGKRMGLPFTSHYVHVNVVLNGEYQGTYLLTEHIRVEKGRVDIDENQGFLVEMDFHYDEDPKFTTPAMNLPFMIHSPEDLLDPLGYDFVRDSIIGLENALIDANFPESGYRNLIDIDTFVDYILINDILMNWELQVPASVYMYKDSGGKIKMGPLWDLDCGYGYEDDTFTFFRKYTGQMPNFPNRDGEGRQFFLKFFEDPKFLAKYHYRWIEIKEIIQSMGAFINDMKNNLRRSADLNAMRWYSESASGDYNANYNGDYDAEIGKLRTWWEQRIAYLDGEISKFPQGNTLWIFQVYGTGYGWPSEFLGSASDDNRNTGSVSHSFVELYNNSDTPISLDTYSVQWANGIGNGGGTVQTTVDAWRVIPLSGTIPAYGSYLIRGAHMNNESGTVGRLQITTFDKDVPNFEMSNRSYKVALVSRQTALTLANPWDNDTREPFDPDLVDLIGARNGNNDSVDAYKGAMRTMSKQNSIRRKNLTDTGNNSTDFVQIDYRTANLAANRPRTTTSGSWTPFP